MHYIHFFEVHLLFRIQYFAFALLRMLHLGESRDLAHFSILAMLCLLSVTILHDPYNVNSRAPRNDNISRELNVHPIYLKSIYSAMSS